MDPEADTDLPRVILARFHRASIARARRFAAVRGSSRCPARVPASPTPLPPVPVASTDNAEVGGSIPPSPTGKAAGQGSCTSGWGRVGAAIIPRPSRGRKTMDEPVSGVSIRLDRRLGG